MNNKRGPYKTYLLQDDPRGVPESTCCYRRNQNLREGFPDPPKEAQENEITIVHADYDIAHVDAIVVGTKRIASDDNKRIISESNVQIVGHDLEKDIHNEAEDDAQGHQCVNFIFHDARDEIILSEAEEDVAFEENDYGGEIFYDAHEIFLTTVEDYVVESQGKGMDDSLEFELGQDRRSKEFNSQDQNVSEHDSGLKCNQEEDASLIQSKISNHVSAPRETWKILQYPHKEKSMRDILFKTLKILLRQYSTEINGNSNFRKYISYDETLQTDNSYKMQ